VVGVLLLLAILVGVLGALFLLDAAHGHPVVVPRDQLLPDLLADHVRAQRAVRRLRHGTMLTLLCVTLFVSAVAITWYGPSRGQPQLQVVTTDTSVCLNLSRG
jgi:NhaP-type Na+/H+ or K+/H+ antiporter